ncbi:MAG TPA: helix-turn-helix transcriptional regulator [Solirubrobacteraceae bacterium]|nr:helix-turn-helix transcriptional regulator [Solirubrobacteraceae bacterium]
MPAKRSAANVALGLAARSLRVERGLAQEAFAGRAGMDRSNYGGIERGEYNVRLDTIVKIAAALDISAAALLERARL